MFVELTQLGLSVQRQAIQEVIYDGVELGEGFRLDLLVDGRLVLEIKSVEDLAPVHFKQVLTYLRIADLRLGLLMNFNVRLLKTGIKRVINGEVE